MNEITKIAVAFPSNRVLDVMECLIGLQGQLASEGAELMLQISKSAGVQERLTVDPEMVDVDGTGKVPAQRSTRRVGRAARPGGHQVVYRVIDPRIVVGRVPHDVRMCLLENGPLSAKDVEAKTGKGQKSVESALYGLRAAGSIESVPVEAGKAVTQRKFSKTMIKQGEPLSA